MSMRTRWTAILSRPFRSRGVTVITASDAGLIEKPDEAHLAFAAKSGCVVYTFNVADFYRLHGQWVNAGREHA